MKKVVGFSILLLIILAFAPSLFFRIQTGWITVAEIYKDLPEGAVCAQAIQQNMYGFPMPMVGSFGSSLCDDPYKMINWIGILVNAVIVGFLAYIFREKKTYLLIAGVLVVILTRVVLKYFAS